MENGNDSIPDGIQGSNKIVQSHYPSNIYRVDSPHMKYLREKTHTLASKFERLILGDTCECDLIVFVRPILIQIFNFYKNIYIVLLSPILASQFHFVFLNLRYQHL